jgi:hypothetical protein
MAANAEKVRHLFLSHAGREEINIKTDIMNEETLKDILGQSSKAIQKRIKTKWIFD